MPAPTGVGEVQDGDAAAWLEHAHDLAGAAIAQLDPLGEA
jgi:hypothetical protein